MTSLKYLWPVGPTFRRASLACLVALSVSIASTRPAAAQTFSETDVEIGRAAWKLAEAQKWDEVLATATRAADPLVGKLFRWLYLSRADNQPSFEAIAGFYPETENWPFRRQLRERAEEAILGWEPVPRLLDWFTKYPPLSAMGRIRFAEALLAVGRKDEAIPLLRKAWIDGDLGRGQEDEFLKRHQQYLKSEDHLARLDRLVWEGRIPEAGRVLPRVDEHARKIAEARIALRDMKGNVNALIARIPEHLRNDPGLVYERVLWRRRKDRLEDARDLVLKTPDPTTHQVAWWRERSLLARDALQLGHISEAYRLAAHHGLTPNHNASFADAEWLAGWIALRFLDDRERARKHFVRMYEAVSYAISKGRGAYWAGRAAEAASDQAEARRWYGLAAEHPGTYYGQLAMLRLDPQAVLTIVPPPPPEPEATTALEKMESARAAAFLQRIGATNMVRPFLQVTSDARDALAWKVLVARYAASLGRVDAAVFLSRRVLQHGATLYAEGFPVLVPPLLPDAADVPPVETALVLAVVRQESTFDVDARSVAGARGLMQLMPATAKTMARVLDLKHSPEQLTEDPDHNLILGHAYLAKTVQDFSGSYVLALAAYNAGPSRARAWVRVNGDPRDPAVDPVDWVESIPFSETRNYVQRVLENVQVYRARLAGASVPLQLDKDLRR